MSAQPPPTDRDFYAVFTDRNGAKKYYLITVEEYARHRALYGIPEQAWTLELPEGADAY